MSAGNWNGLPDVWIPVTFFHFSKKLIYGFPARIFAFEAFQNIWYLMLNLDRMITERIKVCKTGHGLITFTEEFSYTPNY
jgi:hypothetical protein